MITPTRHLAERVITRLRAAGCVYAEDEAGLLIAEAADADTLATMVDRRVAGEPLEQILGWAAFCGLRLAVRPGVFVPRRRTEALVRQARSRCGPGDILVDLCCGVGAVAAAVAASAGDRGLHDRGLHDRGLQVYATDIDPVATGCARQNLTAGEVVLGDLFAGLPPALRGRASVITANAPYVPSDKIALMPAEARDHEAAAALDGGPDGLDLHRRIIAAAPDWLRPGGQLLIETGRLQAETDRTLLEAAGFVATIVADDTVDGTVAIGRLEAAAGASTERDHRAEDPGLS